MMMMCKRLAQVPMLCVPIYNMKLAMMQKTTIFITFSAHTKMAADKRGQIEVFGRKDTYTVLPHLYADDPQIGDLRSPGLQSPLTIRGMILPQRSGSHWCKPGDTLLRAPQKLMTQKVENQSSIPLGKHSHFATENPHL